MKLFFDFFGNAKISLFLEKNKISLREIEILFFLLKNNDRAPLRQVIKVFLIRPSTATALFDQIENMKLISRKTSKNDRRAIDLVLTNKGSSLCAEFKTLFNE